MTAFWWSLAAVGWVVAISLAAMSAVSLTWLIKDFKNGRRDEEAKEVGQQETSSPLPG